MCCNSIYCSERIYTNLKYYKIPKISLIIRANRVLNVFKKARHREGKGGVLGSSPNEKILLHMVLAKNGKYVSSHWKFGTVSFMLFKIFLKTNFENIILIFYKNFFLVECFLCFSGKKKTRNQIYFPYFPCSPHF